MVDCSCGAPQRYVVPSHDKTPRTNSWRVPVTPHTRERAARACAAVLSVGVALVTLWPVAGLGGSDLGVCVICGEFGGVDSVLNIALFVPLGLAVRIGWPSSGRWWLVAIAALSLGIEVLQLRVITGRDASLGDLLFNTLGGAVGGGAASLAGLLWRNKRRRSAAAIGAMSGAVGLFAAVAWALIPAQLPGWHWVQLAPVRMGYETFSGSVRLRTLGREWMAGDSITRPTRAPTDTVQLVVAAAPLFAPGGHSLVARLANPHGVEFQVGVLGHDLTFRQRVNGTLVKLRAPTVRLSGGAAADSGDFTLIVVRNRATWWVRSVSPQRQIYKALPNSLGLGWQLLSPTEHVSQLLTSTLQHLWPALVLLAVGVAAGFAWAPWLAVGTTLGVGLLGLGVLPVLIGLSMSTLAELTVAVVGACLGVWLGMMLHRAALHGGTKPHQ